MNNDDMRIVDSRLAGNRVAGEGAAVDNRGTIDITDSKIVNNVSEAEKGAVFNAGDMVIRGGLITGNTGGGIVNQGDLELTGRPVIGLNTPFDCQNSAGGSGCP